MGRVEFDQSNAVKVTGKVPRLKLESKGDFARIVCLENPVRAWSHRLEMPQIGADGRPVMEEAERKNGEKYLRHKMDWVGSPRCIGDEGILIDKGVDTENCPACHKARTTEYVKPPEPKYAMGVFQYNTRSTTNAEPSSPLGGQVVCWVLSETRFRKIADLKESWGNLQEKDLKLGPLVAKNYQTFEINILPNAAWLADGNSKQWVAAAWKENKFSDEELLDAIGRKVDRKWMVEDLDKIEARWALVNGTAIDQRQPSSADLTEQRQQLDAGLDDIMNQTGQSAPDLGSSAGTGAPVESFDDLLSDTPAPAAAPPAEQAAPAASGPAPDAAGPAAGGSGQSTTTDATADLLADIDADSTPAQSEAAENPQPPAGKPASSGESVSFEDLLG